MNMNYSCQLKLFEDISAKLCLILVNNLYMYHIVENCLENNKANVKYGTPKLSDGKEQKHLTHSHHFVLLTLIIYYSKFDKH